MGSYARCPNCGCDDQDWMVSRCQRGHLFCTGCSVEAGGFLGIGTHSACPRCGEGIEEIVGRIDPKEEESPDSGYSADDDAIELAEHLQQRVEQLEYQLQQQNEEADRRRRAAEEARQTAEKRSN